MSILFGERGFVLELPTSQFRYAFLYSFGVAKSEPMPEHRAWLDREVVEPISNNYGSVVAEPQARKRWMISLLGRASRTGGEDRNLTLSKSRALAVEMYLRSKLSREVAGGAVQFNRQWVGESAAAAAGAPDDVESASDRSVVIHVDRFSMKPVKPPTPPKKPRGVIEPCCYVKTMVKYLEVVKEGWSAYQRSPQSPMRGGSIVVQPHRDLVITGLVNRGWSRERAWELYEHGGLFMKALVTDAMGMTSRVDRELAYFRSATSRCTPDDPGRLCDTMTVHQGPASTPGSRDPMPYGKRSKGGQFY